MASKNFSDWRTEVAKYVKFQSTYNDTVDGEVKETIRDFCRDTAIWKQTLADFSTVADTSTYSLTLISTDGACEICYIDNVKYKEDGADDDQFRNLTPFTQEEKDEYDYGNWSYSTAPDPYKFYSNMDKQLILWPTPTTASTDGVSVRVVVRPTDAATKCPDYIYEDYKQAITIGAAASLMNMPNKPWSNAEMGRFYWEQYLARRDEAYEKVKGMNTKAKHQVYIPFCGGSRSQRKRRY